MCVVALSDGESPSMAGICSTDGITSRLELIRRIDLEGGRLAWVAHAATFRVIWGKVEESTDGGITDDRGVRKNLRVALEEGADPADNMEVTVCPDTLAVAQASTYFTQAEPVDTEALFHECAILRTGSLNDCDRHADPATGAVLTILDLVSANRKRESSKRITYNWEVSTSQPSPLSSSPLWKVWMPIATACCRSS